MSPSWPLTPMLVGGRMGVGGVVLSCIERGCCNRSVEYSMLVWPCQWPPQVAAARGLFLAPSPAEGCCVQGSFAVADAAAPLSLLATCPVQALCGIVIYLVWSRCLDEPHSAFNSVTENVAEKEVMSG